ncbi:hypothetical protein [Megalodesulfovibrio paquesii]
MSVYAILSDNYKKAFPKKSFISPNIPEKKLNGAIKGMDKALDPDSVILIFDSTMFGGAEDGIMFTNDTLYWHTAFSNVISVKYDAIETAEYRAIPVKDKKGRETLEESVVINESSNNIVIKESSVNLEELAKLINLIKHEGTSPCIEDTKNIPLEEMPAKAKLSYVKIIVNFTFADDGVIDPEEVKEIYSLMQRLKFGQEERFSIIQYINIHNESDDLLLKNINECLNDVTLKSFPPSILKDLIAIYTSTKVNGDYNCSKFIMDMAKKLDISTEALEQIKKAIENDKKIFDPTIDDKGLSNGFSEIITGASAVGIPIAALYFSGTVTGLGATGITSGLAALGFGGVLGFSSMATGVGVLLLIGYGAHKGLKVLSGSNEIESRRRKEMMLMNVAKHHQRTMNSLMQDINFLTSKITDAFLSISHLESEIENKTESVKKILSQLKAMSDAGKAASRDYTRSEGCALQTKVPYEIDIKRVAIITESPTAKKYYQYIVDCYDEKAIPSHDESKKDVRSAWQLKNNLSNETLETLNSILSQLGYFAATSVVKGFFK